MKRNQMLSTVTALAGVLWVVFTATANAQLGSVDGNFNAAVNGSVTTVATQPDGKVVIGGFFTQVNGAAQPYLARLNANGSLDSTFNLSAGPAQFVNHVEVAQSKIFVSAGDGIRRFSADGTLDWHYPIYITTFAVDVQQRVIFGGRFMRIENQYRRNLARLTAAGALDATFAPEIGCCAGDGVDSILIAGDKTLVGGVFQSVNGANPAANLARINSDGSFDATFAASAQPLVLAMAAAPDGKIYRASEQTLARHLANGATDSSFAAKSPAGFDERFLAVAVQGDGVIVGGNFTFNDGGTRTHLARFHADGTLDASFTAQPNGPVRAISIQADGSMIIAGDFTQVSGQPHSGVARLLPAAPQAGPALVTARCEGAVIVSWPASSLNVTLQSRDINGGAWSAVNIVPVTIDERQCVTNLVAGAGRIYRLVRP